MSECRVTKCEVSTGSGMNLCVEHLERLETHLITAGEWADIVWETVSRQDTSGGGPRVGGSRESKLPYNVGAADARDNLRGILVSWLALVRDESGRALDCEDTIESIGYHLASHVDWMRKHDAAADFYHEVADAMRQCERVVDRATERISYGPCGGSFEGIDCPGEMKGLKHQPAAHCDTCGETIAVEYLQYWRAVQAWGHLETLPVIVRALKASGQADINYDKAKKWLRREKLYAEICDVPTRTQLFSPARVLAAYHETPQGKRELAAKETLRQMKDTRLVS